MGGRHTHKFFAQMSSTRFSDRPFLDFNKMQHKRLVMVRRERGREREVCDYYVYNYYFMVCPVQSAILTFKTFTLPTPDQMVFFLWCYFFLTSFRILCVCLGSETDGD